MASGNAVLVNFSGGETDPKGRGRFDAPWYATSARKILNFIVETLGPARYRPGFVLGWQTRRGAVGRIINFQISNDLGYMLEFTPGYMRVGLNNQLLTAGNFTITGISQASTGVVTFSSVVGLANGNEIILSGIVGMPQLNGRQVLLAGGSGNTFQIQDPVTGAGINTGALPAYVSGGIGALIYEIVSPYTAVDLPSLQFATTGSLMYLVNPKYVPYKLTVDAYNNFTLATYARTNDPFALATQAVTITDLRPIYLEDTRMGVGTTLTPAADTGSSVAFTAAASVFTQADVGKYIRSFIAQSDTRAASSATLTPAATTGTGIVFTAGSGVFVASDVGSYIRDLSAGGNGSGLRGYAQITGYTSATQVTCTIISNFASTNAIGSGFWEIGSAGYAQIVSVDTFGGGGAVATCNIIQSFGSTAAIAAGNWAVVTVSTVVTLSGTPSVNSTINYTISSVLGATQVNGSSFILVPFDPPSTASPRYILRATSGNTDTDSSGWGIYTSGGTATPVSNQVSLTITGISLGTKTIITFAAGATINQNVAYIFSGITGTTQLNGQTYYLENEADGVHVVDASGNEINSSGWTTYVSGGIATLGSECPLTVAFYEGRLVFGGTNQRPNCLFLSRSPDSSGNARYDDFTGGTDADFACFFQLAPVSGSTDYISWVRGGPDYMFCGTFGGPYRVSGSGLDIPITPGSINVRQFDTSGAEETLPAGLAEMFFIQRGGVAVRSIKVINPYLATFESDDLTLNAQQIAYSPIQRIVLQQGRPDILWVCRADGTLAGMSVHITSQAADEITGWHRHNIGGVAAGVVDIATLQRTTALDQLWVMTQRTVNGVVRTFIEYMADDVSFPDKEDFFSGNKTSDLAAFYGALFRTQEEYIHVDAASTYDGTARGTAAGATLTPGALTGTAVTFTASQNVFTAADVGSELWKKPSAQTGLGAGRAVITAYISATQVTCDIDDNGVAFDSTAAIAAGQWHIAVATIYGLSYLEGQQVAVVTDGAVYSDGIDTTGAWFPEVVVTNGTITLSAPAGTIHVGLPYTGLLQTHNLEMGGRTGPAQAKPRNIAQMFMRFMNSLGVQYGTNPYKMERIEQRSVNAAMDRPAPVFSGIRKLQYSDTWGAEYEKHVTVMQRLPLPAIVEFIDVHYSTGDEGEDE